MIITDANELAAKVHDRMPVLLQPKDFDSWLTGTAGAELLNASAKRLFASVAGVETRQ